MTFLFSEMFKGMTDLVPEQRLIDKEEFESWRERVKGILSPPLNPIK